MKLDFVRFKASDEVELQGWVNDVDGDTAVIHIHGMSGNGYENYFIDSLRDMYAKHNVALFSINTRGHGIISEFRQGEGTKLGGSCFEIFEESINDIQGAINYLKSIGKIKFILQGHSLGCTKVVNYLLNNETADVVRAVLLAPTDMTGWANTEPKHQEYLAKAKQLISEGEPQELVSAECWKDKTPISAKTYPSICEAGSPADIYGEREGGPLLGRITIPTLIPYGTKDGGITNVDGTIEKWLERVNVFKNPNTKTAVIEGAYHSFRSFEQELCDAVEKFIKNKI